MNGFNLTGGGEAVDGSAASASDGDGRAAKIRVDDEVSTAKCSAVRRLRCGGGVVFLG